MAKRWIAMGVCIAVTSCSGPGTAGDDTEARQRAVAEAGARVMPFDLDRTTHVFDKLDDGGMQRVVADMEDPEQIHLVRSHLSDEAERFSRGDFHDPTSIHGEDMPGLHVLATRSAELTIAYREVERGAEIRYSATDDALVTAIHAWFDAQVSDHGAHAEAGHGDAAH